MLLKILHDSHAGPHYKIYNILMFINHIYWHNSQIICPRLSFSHQSFSPYMLQDLPKNKTPPTFRWCTQITVLTVRILRTWALSEFFINKCDKCSVQLLLVIVKFMSSHETAGVPLHDRMSSHKYWTCLIFMTLNQLGVWLRLDTLHNLDREMFNLPLHELLHLH